MYLQFFILLFFKIFQNIGGQCDVYSNYFLLGLLTFNELKTEICQNASDDCIYISLNAPGLAIGTFSGCSTDVKDTLQKIIQERLDVEEAFKQFYYSDSNTLNISHLCNIMNADNKIYSKNIITGKLYYYGICVPQDTGYGEPPANYTAPSTSATPVKCPHNNVVETCSEGYCAMFQYQNLYSNDSEETKGSFQSCPNIIINELYVLQKSEVSTWNYQFYDSLYQAAQLCIDQKSLTMLSKNEDYTFFWSIECYIPTTEESSPTFPPIPDLNFYATTKMISVSTTGSSSTTLSSSVGPSSSEIPTTLISTSTTLRPSTSVRPSTTLIPTTLISTSTTLRSSTSVRPSTTLIPTTLISTSTVISPSTTLHTSTSVKPTTLIVSTIIPTTSNPTSTISPSTTINSQTTLNPSSTSVNIQTTSDIMSTTQSSPTITTSSTTTVHQTSTSNSPSTSISTTTQNIPTTTQINLTTVNSSSTSVSATTENIPTTTQIPSTTMMNASSTSISATTQITSTSVSTTTLNSSSSTQTYDYSATQSIMTSTELNDNVELIVISTTETVSSTNQNIITTTKGGKSNTIISFNTSIIIFLLLFSFQ